MIIAVTKITMNRLLQAAVPTGSMGTGELLLTLDTSRMLVGSSPIQGNPYRGRAQFPYDNMEVLTESSPKNDEIFSLSVRNQQRSDYFQPFVVPATGQSVFLEVSGYDGGLPQPILPISINYISAKIEYNAISSVDNSPIKSGTFRVLGNASTITTAETGTTNTDLAFSVTYDAVIGFTVSVTNNGTVPILLFTKRVVVGF